MKLSLVDLVVLFQNNDSISDYWSLLKDIGIEQDGWHYLYMNTKNKFLWHDVIKNCPTDILVKLFSIFFKDLRTPLQGVYVAGLQRLSKVDRLTVFSPSNFDELLGQMDATDYSLLGGLIGLFVPELGDTLSKAALKSSNSKVADFERELIDLE